MDREDAISYLDSKGKIDVSEGKFSDEDEKEISKVCKQGKIYGDPIANVM